MNVFLYFLCGIAAFLLYNKYFLTEKEKKQDDMSVPFLMFVWGPIGLFSVFVIYYHKRLFSK